MVAAISLLTLLTPDWSRLSSVDSLSQSVSQFVTLHCPHSALALLTAPTHHEIMKHPCCWGQLGVTLTIHSHDHPSLVIILNTVAVLMVVSSVL